MRDKYGLVLKTLADTDIFVFFLGLTIFIGAVLLASTRLMLILAAQKIHISFPEAASLNFIGYFFNNFLPTSIGGDVVKAYYVSRKLHRKISSYTSVFVDRVIGLFTMVFMAFLALVFAGSQIVDENVRRVIYFITLLSILAIAFITNKTFAKKFYVLVMLVKPLEEKLREAYEAINRYKDHTSLMMRSLAISIISQLLFFFSLGIMAFSIGCRIPVMDILLRVPIIGILSLLPSINGLGLREGATVVFFGPLIGKSNAFAVSILWFFILLIISVIGGVIYMLSPQFRVNIKEMER
jgi:uncharacterized protein (TIRG00374 family)